MILTFLSMLVPIAFAGTSDVELAVTSAYLGNGEPAGVRRMLAEVDAPDDLTLTHLASSSDPRIACGVDRGVVYAEFLATEQTWPTSFPVTATCSTGSKELTVAVVQMNQAVDFSLQPQELQAGNTFVYTRPQTASVLKSVPLPASDGPYLPGKYSATRRGVACQVVGDAPDQRLQVVMEANSQTGSGKCSLARPGAKAFVVKLQLDSGPY